MWREDQAGGAKREGTYLQFGLYLGHSRKSLTRPPPPCVMFRLCLKGAMSMWPPFMSRHNLGGSLREGAVCSVESWSSNGEPCLHKPTLASKPFTSTHICPQLCTRLAIQQMSLEFASQAYLPWRSDSCPWLCHARLYRDLGLHNDLLTLCVFVFCFLLFTWGRVPLPVTLVSTVLL